MFYFQGNLKQTVVFDSSDSLPAVVDLPGENLHQYLEYLSFQRLFQASDTPIPLLNRPQLLLSFLPVTFHPTTPTA